MTVSSTTSGNRSPRASETTQARAAVVTLPLGILKSGAVRFRPALPAKAAIIRRMGWGHVARVSVGFGDSLWSNSWLPAALRANRGRDFGFVNAPDLAVPVWWAAKPPAPVLVGWAGGPSARSLTGLSRAALRRAAVNSLAQLAGVSTRAVRGDVVDVFAHDWSSDPFSRGAYSFVAAGAEDGAEALGRPVRGTLFFAGEATAEDAGTVHGAIASGLRAAREVCRAR